jgi:hypothetical protein
VGVEIDNLRAAFEWAVLRQAADDARWIAATLVRWEATAGDTAEAVSLATRALSVGGGLHAAPPDAQNGGRRPERRAASTCCKAGSWSPLRGGHHQDAGAAGQVGAD